MRPAVLIDGGQGHCVRLDRRLFGFHRLSEPLMEQCERLSRSVGLGQTIAGVVAAHISQTLGHGAFLLLKESVLGLISRCGSLRRRSSFGWSRFFRGSFLGC